MPYGIRERQGVPAAVGGIGRNITLVWGADGVQMKFWTAALGPGEDEQKKWVEEEDGLRKGED